MLRTFVGPFIVGSLACYRYNDEFDWLMRIGYFGFFFHPENDLMLSEISRVAISPEAEHSQEVDLYNDYPITLNVKCFPPTKLQPNFNYAGRIIGGSSKLSSSSSCICDFKL